MVGGTGGGFPGGGSDLLTRERRAKYANQVTGTPAGARRELLALVADGRLRVLWSWIGGRFVVEAQELRQRPLAGPAWWDTVAAGDFATEGEARAYAAGITAVWG